MRKLLLGKGAKGKKSFFRYNSIGEESREWATPLAASATPLPRNEADPRDHWTVWAQMKIRFP